MSSQDFARVDFEANAKICLDHIKAILDGALYKARIPQLDNAAHAVRSAMERVERLETQRKNVAGSGQGEQKSFLEHLHARAKIAFVSLRESNQQASEKAIEIALSMVHHALRSPTLATLGLTDEAFEGRLSQQEMDLFEAVEKIDDILKGAHDYEFDEMAEQALMTTQDLICQSLTGNSQAIEAFRLPALRMCMGELQYFIDEAQQYDLDPGHVNALNMGIEVLGRKLLESGGLVSPRLFSEQAPDQAQPLDFATAARALDLLRQYRAAPKFSNDHNAIKQTVALEDEIDAFLSSLAPPPAAPDKKRPSP